jgi:hypothetical protein
MHKLSAGECGHERAFVHPATFARTAISPVAERLVAGLPWEKGNAFSALVQSLAEPLLLLYVLHTPRGEAEPGRYQSPDLTQAEVQNFLKRFSGYLQADARFDLWVYSPDEKATLVWDRHNMIHGYGPLSRFEDTLRSHGFEPGHPAVSTPHIHHYRSEFDTDAVAVIKAFSWKRTPLRPEDEQ